MKGRKWGTCEEEHGLFILFLDENLAGPLEVTLVIKVCLVEILWRASEE